MSDVVYRAEDDKYRLEIMQDSCPESPREWDNIGTMVCSHRRYDLGDEQAKNIDEYSSWDEWLQGEVYDLYGGEDNVACLPLYLYDHSGITMNTTGFSCPWDSGQVGWIYATKEKLRQETGYSDKELFSKEKHRIPEVGERVRIRKFGEDWGQVVGIDEYLGNTVYTIDFDYNKIPSFKKAENVVSVSLEEIAEVMSNRAEEMLKGEVETYDDYLTGRVYGFDLSEVHRCECCGTKEYESIDSCWGFYGDDLKQLAEDMKYNVSEEVRYMFDKLEAVY